MTESNVIAQEIIFVCLVMGCLLFCGHYLYQQRDDRSWQISGVLTPATVCWAVLAIQLLFLYALGGFGRYFLLQSYAMDRLITGSKVWLVFYVVHFLSLVFLGLSVRRVVKQLYAGTSRVSNRAAVVADGTSEGRE